MRIHLYVAASAALLLAACGSGGSAGTTSTIPAPQATPITSGGTTQTQSVDDSINTANAVGSPLKDFQTANSTINPLSLQRAPQSIANGTCNNGMELFVPDKKGDANSTESVTFFDAACTQVARDTVRIYNMTSSSSETVNRTESLYALNNTTPIAVRTDAVSITGATFDAHGFPAIASGYVRSSTNSLGIAGSKTINSGDEMIVGATSGGVNAYCGDSAGYNATGVASTGKTYGWQGSETGTRTANADGSVTWATTHAGTAETGSIGSLSLATGVANTACPIVTPMFTLAGGTAGGTSNIPVSATYLHGVLTNFAITNATLANGNTLNVTTNASVGPGSSSYITGVIAKAGAQVATFAVDAFGSGTLTVTSSGAQFVITDWHVVK